MIIESICPIEKCTGCGACFEVCAHSAINMIPDAEGFLRPIIDSKLCVGCGLCQVTCPVNTPFTGKMNKPLKVYSGWSLDEDIRINSSSGGAFTEIAKLTLQKGGVVFGVAMDENVCARHIYVEDTKDLYRLRGSKYVQSVIGDSYKQAKKFLLQGREVLFSGTPCQIAGFRNFLRKDYDNLITIDLICHGVPSPKVFNDYKTYIESIINEKVTDVKFRCKKSSWIFFNMGINPHVEKNGNINYSYIGNYYADPYIRVFLRDNILRPNCYQCLYASIERVGDFTIADWWGYKSVSDKDKDFDKKGVSLLMCNTNKAVSMVNCLDMDLRERTIEEALNTNSSLKCSFPMPATRTAFWNDYTKMDFNKMVKKWMFPETLLLSKYLRIYYKQYHLIYHIVRLYERIINKIKAKKLLVKVYAK